MVIKMMCAEDGHGEASRMGRHWLAESLILLASLGGLACGAGAKRTAREAAPAIAVSLETAAEIPWADGIPVTAGLLPFRRALPGTILMGRVEEVLHREGDRVRSGEVLARVESRDMAARLAQAEAAVAAAKAQEENARLSRERMDRLQSRQAASRKNVEDATSGYEAAAAGLHAAEEGVKAARVAYGYTQVTAPFAGVVTERRVEAGDTAAPGMPLFVLEDTSKMKVEASVAESSLAGLAVGQPVEVSVDASAGGPRKGVLSEILPAGDPRSRTFTVRVVLDNRDGALRSGMFARLLIEKGSRNALAVPESSLVRQGPLTGLFVADSRNEGGSLARLRWITAGETREGRVEILTGLSAGERFVLSPPPALEDGGKIEVR
jgi:RND family efflux transporter MFP subunit